MKEQCGGRKPCGDLRAESGKRSGDCGPAEVPAVLLDSLNRDTLRRPPGVGIRRASSGNQQAAHL